MKGAIIKGVNERGEEAIKQAYKESVGIRNRIKFRAMGFKQNLVNKNPYTLEFQINKPDLQTALIPEDFKNMIKRVMRENGAEDSDYTIEVY